MLVLMPQSLPFRSLGYGFMIPVSLPPLTAILRVTLIILAYLEGVIFNTVPSCWQSETQIASKTIKCDLR